MEVKVNIVSGFLGAGKTMLIKKFLSEAYKKEKIVVIENEFGQVSIDGSILNKTGIKIKEINAGCICCSSTLDFKSSFKEIIGEFQPQRIIVEPSGVSKLSEIIKIINLQEFKDKLVIDSLITVVDPNKYKMYIKNFGEFYRDQIQNAKVIILSRTDTAEYKKVQEVLQEIRKLNSRAEIITTPWKNIPTDLILEVIENAKNAEEPYKTVIKKVDLLKSTAKIKEQSAKEVFQTYGILTSKLFSKDYLEKILKSFDSNKTLGNIVRAKGIVQIEKGEFMQFDFVPEEFSIKEASVETIGKLCIIGSELNKNALEEIFK